VILEFLGPPRTEVRPSSVPFEGEITETREEVILDDVTRDILAEMTDFRASSTLSLAVDNSDSETATFFFASNSTIRSKYPLIPLPITSGYLVLNVSLIGLTRVPALIKIHFPGSTLH